MRLELIGHIKLLVHTFFFVVGAVVGGNVNMIGATTGESVGCDVGVRVGRCVGASVGVLVGIILHSFLVASLT